MHGHPETNDDAILESGNRLAKNFKCLLFWGGTGEKAADGTRAAYLQERSTGKRNNNGELIYKEVRHPANISAEAALLQNTYVDQIKQAERARGAKQRRATAETKAHLKDANSAAFDSQCTTVCDGLEKLAALIAEKAEPPSPPEEQMDM